MITITSNIDDAINQFNEEFNNIDVEKMTREQATTVMAMIRVRVHEQGQDANGGQIGTYSKGYLAIRSGIFQNSGKISKGKNKGKVKDAGKYTKGGKSGSLRTKYNRGTDPKVILSLTRQMESDMSIIPVQNGFGIGYNNSKNYNKAVWAEQRYKKQIFAVSDAETEAIDEISSKYLNK